MNSLPREIILKIYSIRYKLFRDRIKKFSHIYRSVSYLKTYIIPSGDTFIIKNTPNFWAGNSDLSFSMFTKYALYVLRVITKVR